MNEYDQVELELREQTVIVNFKTAPAEPDVGIMTEYVDEFHLTDLKGNMLDWDLTGNEEEAVLDKCWDYLHTRPEPDDPYDPTDDPLNEHRKLT